MRRTLCVAAALGVALAAIPAAAAEFVPAACQSSPFLDVPFNQPFCAWIQQLKSDDISAGCGGGNFCPEAPVTRQQAAAMFERMMRGSTHWEPWRGALHRTLIVNPVVDQLDTHASGLRLQEILNEIGAINDASATNPYLIKLEPGVYDLQGAGINLLPFVDLEGSGEGVSIIRGARSGPVVFGADDVELRSLTIENLGNGSNSYGINISGDTIRMLHVTVRASGGTSSSIAIVQAGNGTELDEVTAIAQAGGVASATAITIAGSPNLVGVVAQSTSAGGTASGVSASSGSANLTDVSISASGATLVRGVSLETGASATIRRSTATATSLTSGADAVGLYLLDGNATAYDSLFSGAATNAWGVLAARIAGSHTLRFLNSRLSGSDHTIEGDTAYTISIGDTQLSGGAALAAGSTLICFGAYDENFQNAGGLAACP